MYIYILSRYYIYLSVCVCVTLFVTARESKDLKSISAQTREFLIHPSMGKCLAKRVHFSVFVKNSNLVLWDIYPWFGTVT